MRTFLNSKAIAATIQAELAIRGVTLSRSDSLEVTAKALGAADWNALSAKIKQAAADPVTDHARDLQWPEVARPFYERHVPPEERGGQRTVLFREARELYTARADSDSDEVRDLARRWLSLSNAVNGGNAEIRKKYSAAYREALADPHIAPKLPLSSDLLAWFGPALVNAANPNEARN